MAKLIQTEHDIQANFFSWVHLMEQKDERFKNIFAIPNGGLRNIRVAQKLKKEGVRSGCLDVAIMVPSITHEPSIKKPGMMEVRPFHGAFIEFKAGKNKLTKEQLAFANRMKKQRYYCALCYTTESAIDFTNWYLGIK